MSTAKQRAGRSVLVETILQKIDELSLQVMGLIYRACDFPDNKDYRLIIGRKFCMSGKFSNDCIQTDVASTLVVRKVYYDDKVAEKLPQALTSMLG